MIQNSDGWVRSAVLVSVLVATVLLVGMGTGTAAAQSAPTEEFNKTFGGADFDAANSVVQTSDGGFALAGGTESFGAGSDRDAWLIKTDEDGNEQFNKTFGGSDDYRAFSVVETSDGGFALAGGTGSRSIVVSDNDALLIKTDSNGNEQFNKTYGGARSDGAGSVIETSDGGFALAGLTGGANFFTPGNAWLIKTDEDGNEQFNKTFGGRDFEQVTSVLETTDGGFALAGSKVPFGARNLDAWLIRTGSSGNERFNETFGGEDTDTASTVTETSDGGFALAGGTESFGAGSDRDAWLIKTDRNDPPTALFTFTPSSPDTSDTVTFDASSSSDSDGTVQTYEWDFDGDGTTDVTRSEPLVTHTYDALGEYAVTLTVTDDDGATDSTVKTVEVRASSTSPVDGVSDALWTVVTQDDGSDGLSLADLGNAIQEYQKNPSDATVNSVSITLSDLGALIQYYRTEVV